MVISKGINPYKLSKRSFLIDYLLQHPQKSQKTIVPCPRLPSFQHPEYFILHFILLIYLGGLSRSQTVSSPLMRVVCPFSGSRRTSPSDHSGWEKSRVKIALTNRTVCFDLNGVLNTLAHLRMQERQKRWSQLSSSAADFSLLRHIGHRFVVSFPILLMN